MNNQCIDIIGLLQTYGAVIQGDHFALASGLHAGNYFDIRTLAGEPEAIRQVSSLILAKITEMEKDNLPANSILVGPETMGRSLVEATSLLSLSSHAILPCAWCEPSPDGSSRIWSGKLRFAERIVGKKAFIVDDVLTTAGTMNQTIDLIRDSKAEVGGVIVVVNRDPDITAKTLGVPWFISLIEARTYNYSPENCPLCQKKIPMRAHPGHGYEWLESHPGYPVKD